MNDQLINQIFKERYQIQSLLGRNTGRRTFLAQDLHTQSQVVVKLLLFNPDFTWDDLKLFEREAETLRSLDHPAIPQYLDYFEVETEIGKGSALVQSYIEAKSLGGWVEAGRSFSEAELKGISTQLLKIIQYLHSHLPPVIHRDIKPSNILLTDRSGNSPGTVYLVDFGSVQTVVQSGTITIVGTYGYMPPEQFGGRTTPASDLYSLGATLIYLITGKHPSDLPTRRGQIQFEANSQISQKFEAWIKCLIQPDLEDRFQTAQKALEMLKNDELPLNGFSTIQPKLQDSKIPLHQTDKRLNTIRQPSNPQCTIQKSSDFIKVSAPPRPSETVDRGSDAWILLIIIGFVMVSGLTAFHIMILIIIFTIFLLHNINRMPQSPQRIILEIDKKTARLYKEFQSQPCCAPIDLKNIRNIRVVYCSSQKSDRDYYHVQLRTYNSCIVSRLLVGNRERWLSEDEAYWIAYELGDWLKVPVTEVEVQVTSRPGLYD